MEVQAYITKKQQKGIIVPYGTVEKLKSQFKWDSKYVTPMELLRLLWHTELKHQKLELGERAILAVLLNHVNLDRVRREGIYDAYPSVQTILAYTGMCDRSARAHRKLLEEKGWVKLHSGTGRGWNNHYYINARKIVECYKLTHPEDENRYQTGGTFDAIESVPFLIQRNTSGLRRGRSVPQLGCKPVQ